MNQADRARNQDTLPAGGRDRHVRHRRLRHGDRQAGRPLRRPCGPAEIDRSLLPGDRPRRPRRRARRYAHPLRPRRHAPAPPADRGKRRPTSRSASSANGSTLSSALCEAPRCRRQTLLAYFGETTQPCGNCDLCIDGVDLVRRHHGGAQAALGHRPHRRALRHRASDQYSGRRGQRSDPALSPRPAQDLRGRQGPFQVGMALPAQADLRRRPRRPRSRGIRPLDHHRARRHRSARRGAHRAAFRRADEAARAPPPGPDAGGLRWCRATIRFRWR